MLRKTVSGIMLTLLLASMLTLAFDIKSARSSGTIYIRPDGSVDPSIAPIRRNGNLYTITANIYGSIIVERDNIIVEGADHTLQSPSTGEWTGIDLSRRSNVTIKDVTIKNFNCGIFLLNSSDNSISGNKIANNECGIFLLISSCNRISGNIITACTYYGFWLGHSSDNVLRGNSISDNRYSIGVWGLNLSAFVNDVDASNTVEGKPIYYWIGRMNDEVPLDAGYVVLVNCANITVKNLDLTKNAEGIVLAFTTDSTITQNKIIGNEIGIRPCKSSNNAISENEIVSNEIGIFLFDSSHNIIYHNDFINNPIGQAVYEFIIDYPPYMPTNTWDNGYPSGGNYWSNYAGVDEFSGPNQDQLGSDGISDSPYIIAENNRDNYPLMNPWTSGLDDDVLWLATAIMSEASVGTREEQIAVGWTVLNRFDSGRFGDSIEGIVKSAYAYNQEPDENIMNLAESIYRGEIHDNTAGATHFFSPRSMTHGSGPYPVPSTSQEAFYPYWAEPKDGWETLTETTTHYVTINNELEWRQLVDIRNWYFMFYHPFIGQQMIRPVEGRITSHYGLRLDPISHELSFHKGIDIGGCNLKPVRAPADGTVSDLGYSHSIRGNWIEIRHLNVLRLGSISSGRTVFTKYFHLNAIDVSLGDEVEQGDTIGTVGQTGRVTGPHLHFEVWEDDQHVLPLLYVDYPWEGFVTEVLCPVDIVLTDPDGLTVSKELIEIETATYLDDNFTDRIWIADPKPGRYQITVVPETDASPTDTYCLRVYGNNTGYSLAEDVSINDIPTQPYTVGSTETGITLPTDLNLDRTVNILDIAIVAQAFGTREGDDRYNPIADVAEPYNEINILDIATVAKDYGKTV